MEIKFHTALLGTGCILALTGAVVGLMASGQISSAAGLAGALSAGVTSSYFAVFAGVLMGVGLTLAAGGAIIASGRRRRLAGASLALAAVSLVAAAVSVSNAENFSFGLLLAFITGLSAGASFLIMAVASSASGFFSERMADAGGKKK